MRSARTISPITGIVVTPRMPEAVVARQGDSFEGALDRIGLAEQLGILSLVKGPGPRAAIAADGLIPVHLLSWLFSKGVSGITAIKLSVERILPENAAIAVVDASQQTAAASGLSICSPWIDHDVRIVLSRVKTDGRGAYSLCGAALESCMAEGGLEKLLRHYPPHCAIVADPSRDAPFVASDHPLLADWVGATLMGRDPYSARSNAEWFRKGLLPRAYRVHGDTSTVSSWLDPPSLKRPLPYALRGNGAAPAYGNGWTEVAGAWMSFVKTACEPFLTPASPEAEAAGRMPSAREALIEKIALAVTPESMGELLEALLKGLSLLLSSHPVLKEDVRPLRAGYCIATSDNRMRVYARFTDGVLTATRSPGGPAHVTLVFKDGTAMLRLFASPKPDLLDAMLKQQISFEGNLNYLLKLAYLLRRVTLAVKGDLRSVPC